MTNDKTISFEIEERLDDDNTVAAGSAEPGDETVRYEGVRGTFRATADKWGHSGEYVVGDEESTLFVASNGGELEVSYGPSFAPIETSLKVHQYELARRELHEGLRMPQYGLLFDDGGLIVFVGDGVDVIVAPQIWPWDKPSAPTGPRAPGGPQI